MFKLSTDEKIFSSRSFSVINSDTVLTLRVKINLGAPMIVRSIAILNLRNYSSDPIIKQIKQIVSWKFKSTTVIVI